MKLAALVSGGKDSIYAAYLEKQAGNEIAVILAIKSKNPESYMFHYPNIDLVKLQAQAMDIPLIFRESKGEKEKELKDIKSILQEAVEKYKIEGVVSGALFSKYQKSRIDKICGELGIKSLAPLWGENPQHQWKEMLELEFKIMIIGIGAGELDQGFLGQIVDQKLFEILLKLDKKCHVSVGFEGGEMESLVIDCPLFKKKLKIINAEKIMTGEFSGYYDVKQAKLAEK